MPVKLHIMWINATWLFVSSSSQEPFQLGFFSFWKRNSKTMSSAALSNDDWVDFLYRNNVLENEDERQKRWITAILQRHDAYLSNNEFRQQVIALLQTAVASFTRDVIRDRGLKKLDPTCQLLAFGSYGLGGYTRNADMDLVLICPWSIKRQDFYRFFTNILKKMATCRDVDVKKEENDMQL